jgi:hypothetical protein
LREGETSVLPLGKGELEGVRRTCGIEGIDWIDIILFRVY